jgi:hypothetical protein
MNTTLSTVSDRLENSIEQEAAPRFERRRVGPLDRVALHLGVALVAWSRRPRAIESRERRARRFEQYVARLERERVAERELLLTVPRR